MRETVMLYLSHAENRIHNCRANALLFGAKGDQQMVEQAQAGFYKWVGLAQEQHQEDHF